MANGAFGFSHTLVVDNHDVARVSQPESKSSIFVLAIVDWLNAPYGRVVPHFHRLVFNRPIFVFLRRVRCSEPLAWDRVHFV